MGTTSPFKLKYGPQVITHMDNYIYIGGAVGDSRTSSLGALDYSTHNFFMPVLIKLTD